MTAVRSLLFNVAWYGWMILLMVTILPVAALISRPALVRALRLWPVGTNFLLRWLVGVTVEVRGWENIPATPCIIACKHQSAWETAMALVMVDKPTIILKIELMNIPVFGWLARSAGMISVARGDGAKAMRAMLAEAKAATADGRSFIIFPEGTRTAVGQTLPYKPGIALLHRELKVPIVPAALNSGLFWGRNSFMKYPGRMILEFLPPLPAEVEGRAMVSRLQAEIETASARLADEARRPRA